MISQEPRNDCLGLIYPGQYTLKFHDMLLHYSFLKIFNIPFIDLLLCQQSNGVIILSNKNISLSGGLLIIFYIYFSCSLFLVWFWQYNPWDLWTKWWAKFSLAPLAVVELCRFLSVALSTLHFPVKNKASDD